MNLLSSAYRFIPRIAKRLGVPLRPILWRAGLIVDSAVLTYGPSAYSTVCAGVIGGGGTARAGW